MRKRRLFTICLFSAVLIAGMAVWKAGAGRERTRAAYGDGIQGIIVAKDMSFLDGRELRRPECNPGVLFEDTILPYDRESNTLFLAQSAAAEDWAGALSPGEGILSLYVAEDAYWQKKKDAIRDGHAFRIWAVG